MADAVTTNTLFSDNRRHVIQISNEGDGTGESGVVKIDRSALLGPSGAVPTDIVIEELEWNVQGFNYVVLLWDEAGGDETIAVLSGAGYKDYRAMGGLKKPSAPAVATDGDVQVTTDGGADGASYDITISARLKD